MGGMTVMQFCGDHPEVLDDRVAGVVFVATRAHAVVPALVAGTVRRLGDRAQAKLDAGGQIPSRLVGLVDHSLQLTICGAYQLRSDSRRGSVIIRGSLETLNSDR